MRQKNHALLGLLEEANWSRADLARSVNHLGNAQGLSLHYDRTSVAHWLTGSRPRSPVPALVAQALTQRIQRLVQPLDTGLIPMEGDSADWYRDLAAAANPLERLHRLCLLDSHPTRRGLLAAVPYQMSEAFLDPQETPGEIEWVSGSRSSLYPRSAAEMFVCLGEMFAHFDDHYGGGRARSSFAACLRDNAISLLAEVHPSPAHRELSGKIAWLALLLAEMHADMESHGAAQLYHLTALDLAGVAKDRAAQTMILTSMADSARTLNHTWYALRMLGSAATFAVDVPPWVSAVMLAQRGAVRARTGDASGSRADLRAAQRALMEAGEMQGAPLLYSRLLRANVCSQRAHAHDALGSSSDAIEAYRTALEHIKDHRSRAFALTHGRLAELLLRLGHLEAARPHIDAFCEHRHRFVSARVQACLELIRQRVNAYQCRPAAQALIRSIDRESSLPVVAR